jgi:hypothetical protein
MWNDKVVLCLSLAVELKNHTSNTYQLSSGETLLNIICGFGLQK